MSDVLALCYHAVSDSWPAALAVTGERFERQVESLMASGYRGTTFLRAVTDPPFEKTLAVTFDDGYRSVLERAFPILARRGLPATVFVPTDFPERTGPLAWPGIEQWLGGPFESELTSMTWPELRWLSDQGWEVGAHTRSHPALTTLGDEALREQLEGSRARCEAELGHPCRSIAYPYGDADDRVEEATRRAGFLAAGALPGQLTASVPLRWPRVGVYRDDDRLRYSLKVHPVARRLRGSPAWGVVDAVRRRRRPQSNVPRLPANTPR